MKKILIRADADATIGHGHVARCLTLGEQLVARGHTVVLASRPLPAALATRARSQGITVRTLDQRLRVEAWKNWEDQRWSPDAQCRDAEEAMGSEYWDAVLLDHYLLDAPWLERVMASRAVIDDLANRPLPCNLLIDPTLGRSAAAYAHLVPEPCKLLLGPRFAMMRPQFMAARPEALTRRSQWDGRVTRVLIALGGGAFADLALRLAVAVRARGLAPVVLGPKPTGNLVPAGLDWIAHSEDVAPMMIDCDVGIGGAGGMSWERACLGQPAIAVVLAANQAGIAKGLDEAGAAMASPPDADAVLAALDCLLADPAALKRMSARASAITDGAGAERVCDALEAL